MTERRSPSRRKTFLVGLFVRLLGAALIVLGDGHGTLLAKTSVVLGVLLMVGGIAILRWLLFKTVFRRRKVQAAE